MRTTALFTLLLLLNLGGIYPSPLRAADFSDGPVADDPVAEIGGQPVSLSELESFAADQLRELDKKKHLILESNLAGLIETKLLEREAERRETTVAELLAAEIGGQIEPVTDAEVDAWYEQNKARVRQPKSAVADQVRSYLEQQRAEPIRQELIAGLRERYDVRLLFEPLRVEVDAGDGPAKGPQDAAVTVVEFSDYQCPACKRLQGDFHRLKEAYGDRVQFAFRQYPLTQIHPQAFKAAEAALCAGDQGRFWDMHDDLFAHQRELGIDQIKARARGLELDGEAFDACLDAGTYRGQVQADLAAGRSAGVTGTPSIFVNGRPVTLLRGASPFDQIAATIDDELLRAAP